VNVVRIGCIVEGRGDEASLPILVHRIARIETPTTVVITEPMVRRDRGLLVQQARLVAQVNLVARKLSGKGGILILIDADDDCPAMLGPQMLHWAQSTRPDIPTGVVLATREFEAWFIAAAESLQGQRGLTDSLTPHPQPESIRDAKGRLADRRPRSQGYSAPVDQPALARLFDLEMARARSDSFDKCYREISRLLHALA